MSRLYTILYCIIWPFFNLVHPCKAIGRANIPEGGALVCANHTALNDPLFIVFAFRHKYQLHPMAKAEFMSIPVLGWLLKKAGVFAVERGKSDVGAIKKWFGRTPVVIGEPYQPYIPGKKGSAEEYRAVADDLVERIRALEAQAK